MADGEEEAVDGDVKQFLLVGALEAYQMGTLHAVVTKEAHGVGIEQDFYLLVLLDALLHRLAGTQVVLAHDEIDLAGEMAQVIGLFTGGITATHDSHDLLAVEEAVARRTCRNALSRIFRLIGQTQVLGRGTRSHDDGVGSHLFSTVEGNEEGTLPHIYGSHEARFHLGTQIHRLLAHILHQLEAVNTLGEAREILNRGRLGQLAAHLQALDEQAVDGRAHQIYRCGISGRTGADNQTLCMVHFVLIF